MAESYNRSRIFVRSAQERDARRGDNLGRIYNRQKSSGASRDERRNTLLQLRNVVMRYVRRQNFLRGSVNDEQSFARTVRATMRRALRVK